MVLIADLLVQTNCKEYREFYEWYNTLSRSEKARTKKLERVTTVLKTMSISTIDLIELNKLIEYRLLRDLDYKNTAYKNAKLNHSVQVIEILNSRPAMGLLGLYGD